MVVRSLWRPKKRCINVAKNYKSKLGQIKANCVGFGDVSFKFVVELPIPDNVKLDWSDVEGDIYKGLEHGIIVSILKKMKTIPLTYKGEQPLFNETHAQLGSIKLSNMNTKGKTNGV